MPETQTPRFKIKYPKSPLSSGPSCCGNEDYEMQCARLDDCLGFTPKDKEVLLGTLDRIVVIASNWRPGNELATAYDLAGAPNSLMLDYVYAFNLGVSAEHYHCLASQMEPYDQATADHIMNCIRQEANKFLDHLKDIRDIPWWNRGFAGMFRESTTRDYGNSGHSKYRTNKDQLRRIMNDLWSENLTKIMGADLRKDALNGECWTSYEPPRVRLAATAASRYTRVQRQPEEITYSPSNPVPASPPPVPEEVAREIEPVAEREDEVRYFPGLGYRQVQLVLIDALANILTNGRQGENSYRWDFGANEVGNRTLAIFYMNLNKVCVYSKTVHGAVREIASIAPISPNYRHRLTEWIPYRSADPTASITDRPVLGSLDGTMVFFSPTSPAMTARELIHVAAGSAPRGSCREYFVMSFSPIVRVTFKSDGTCVIMCGMVGERETIAYNGPIPPVSWTALLQRVEFLDAIRAPETPY